MRNFTNCVESLKDPNPRTNLVFPKISHSRSSFSAGKILPAWLFLTFKSKETGLESSGKKTEFSEDWEG